MIKKNSYLGSIDSNRPTHDSAPGIFLSHEIWREISCLEDDKSYESLLEKVSIDKI